MWIKVSFESICKKIEHLEIQGASNVAKNGLKALILRLEEKSPKEREKAIQVLEEAKTRLFQTRPTEPFLRNAIRFILQKAKETANIQELWETVEQKRDNFLKMIEEGKEKIATVGARRIQGTVLTYCHSSTAMGIIKKSKEDIDQVYVTETRPQYQGRITAKELVQEGIETNMIVDSACRHFMKEMDVCLVGADVITSQGNIINKIGTSTVALVANEARIPFYVATNLLKFDPKTMSGALEKIEQRDWREVWENKPEELRIRNPAFDVTPANYIDGLITDEAGIISPQLVVNAVKDHFPFILEE